MDGIHYFVLVSCAILMISKGDDPSSALTFSCRQSRDLMYNAAIFKNKADCLNGSQQRYIRHRKLTITSTMCRELILHSLFVSTGFAFWSMFNFLTCF